jgi:MFS transporter, DHA2 family, multidrug resistance protein
MANGESQGFHPGHNPWAVALTVTIATFMEIMDTSIANVALPHIAGGLSSGQDEATWVLTSYLVSNAVILPISAWLSDRFGRKRFYMTCVALFAVSSFLCGIAPSLPLLIFFRVLQGAGGGGLAPSEQAILADTFPEEKRGMAFAVYGMAVVLAPAIGPTLGGWITDQYNWRWIFFINVPLGILSLVLTSIMVQDPPHIKKAQKKSKNTPIDFTGLALIAIGLGALQVVLDKGQRDDWFNSDFIAIFCVLAAFGIVAFVVWELRQKNPIVDLGLYKNPNFAVANVLQMVIFAALLGTTVLIPQFAQSEIGYTAQKAGELLTPGGFAIILLMPLVGFLVRKVDARYLIAIGCFIMAFSLFRMTDLIANIDFRSLMLWRVFQACAMAFLFVPINTMAFTDMPPGASNQVSAMTNLMRNIGGSIGISAVTTLVQRREQVHQYYLAKNTYEYSPQLQQLLSQLTERLGERTGQTEALRQAYGEIYRFIQLQASVLAYIDTFWILGGFCLVAVLLLFFAKKTKPGSAAAAH